MSSGGRFQLLTSPGPAGIAVVRVRGDATQGFLVRHVRRSHGPQPETWLPGSVFRAALLDESGGALDDALISVHAAAPEWDIRLYLHGNPWLVGRCTELLRAAGLEQATDAPLDVWAAPDLLAAEAYALLPRMTTLRGARWLLAQVARLRTAIDTLLSSHSLETTRRTAREIAQRQAIADWFLRPLRVALAGPPNVGKSTLVNALSDRAVSVVSPTPGTTRDWVEVAGEVDGFPVVWLDTAGLRASADELEQAGIERTRRRLDEADAIVLVLDIDAGSQMADSLNLLGGREVTCAALNKSDLVGTPDALRALLPESWQSRSVSISAKERTGLDELRRTLLENVGRTDAALEPPAAFTPRQVALLETVTTSENLEAGHRGLKLLRGLAVGG